MSDQQTLLLVLILIYLTECFVWVGYGTIAFRSVLGRWYKPLDPPIFPGNDRGGWALLNLLPPFGGIFICHQWPLAISGDQVGPPTQQSINFKNRPRFDAVSFPWKAAAKLDWHGRALMLAGEPVARLQDEPAAQHVSQLLVDLAKVAPEHRQEQIRRAIARSFNTKLVEKRLAAYWRATSLLRMLSIIFFLLLFVLVPVSVYLGRFEELVYRVLPMLLATWVAVLVTFYFVHRRLHPSDWMARWKSLLTMVFTPTACCRACDAISRNLLRGFDPVAVAAVLCRDATFRGFARQVVQDLRHPLPAVGETPLDEHQQAIAADFRQRLLERTEKVMRQRGVEPTPDTSPTPADPSLKSYCPRCRLEYMVESGTCRDCGERPLEPLVPVPSQPPVKLAYANGGTLDAAENSALT